MQKNESNPIKQAMYEDPFLKYKEHDREQRRERRVKTLQAEREAKYKKKLDEWLLRESNRDKDRDREN